MILALLAGLALAADPADHGAVLPGRPPAAAVASAPAPGDTSTRVPGCVLRLGWDHARVSTLGSFRLGGSNPETETREGEVRWFGYPAKVALTYRSGRLSEVRLTAASASPRFADFVPDELRRMGYRRTAAEGKPREGTSTWEGAAIVHLTLGSGMVAAEVSPRTPPAPVAESEAAAPAEPAPAAPPAEPAPAVTPAAPPEAPPLDFSAPGAESLAAPRLVTALPLPDRPRIAVDAGVFGRVLVRVIVGIDGRVEHVAIERGIAELNNAAIEWASEQRYEPYLREGRPVRFTTLMPVAFRPARPAAEGGKP